MARVIEGVGRRVREESGAVMVMTAVLIVVILGMAALAVDLGSFYQAQRHAQSAADAAALAAINDLPTSPTTASTDANNYVSSNYPGASATETYPGSTTIKVTVTANTPSFFGNIFGITSENVSASATAGYPVGTPPAALFAYDSSCSGDGIKITGNNANVPGGITSNGTLTVSTNNNTSLGGTTYGGPSSCSDSVSGGTFASGPTLNPNLTPWPFDYSNAALKPPCDFTDNSSGTAFSTLTASSTPGVYCAPSGTISIPGGTYTGFTFIANNIAITSNNTTITPASNANGLGIYYLGTSLFNISVNGFSTSTIFAPNAEVELSYNSSTSALTGFIEAKDVWLNGNNEKIIGTGPPSTGYVGALQA
jgi:Flp pilus assembly protein TadG